MPLWVQDGAVLIRTNYRSEYIQAVSSLGYRLSLG